MIFVKQADMPESCYECGMLQYYESEYCGGCYECPALEFLGKSETIHNGYPLSEELKNHRSPKCPLRIIPPECLEMTGDENQQGIDSRREKYVKLSDVLNLIKSSIYDLESSSDNDELVNELNSLKTKEV